MPSVTIHKYTESLTAIEFGPQDTTPKNFLVFIGGLGDGFLTVPYMPMLAESISKQFGQEWVVVEALIRSSYLGFGTGSLNRDCFDLSMLVKFLRQKRGRADSKVILMGHSTGCQDVMQYITKFIKERANEPLIALNACILQAPVSDREAIINDSNVTEINELLKLSKEYIEKGMGEEMLPLRSQKYTFGSPVNANRFSALLSVGGADDYFSSDLSDEENIKLFGKIEVPVLFLLGERDEFVPESVEKEALLSSWKKACTPCFWSVHSKIIPGATHKLDSGSAENSVEILLSSILDFIKDNF